jgi:hypothetical protein
MNAGMLAATSTTTLQGDNATSSTAYVDSVTVLRTMANASITSDNGRLLASRRAFCILS